MARRLKRYAHELANNWITRGKHRFRFGVPGSFVAAVCACQCSHRRSLRADVGQRIGIDHRRRAEHLDVATLLGPRRLESAQQVSVSESCSEFRGRGPPRIRGSGSARRPMRFGLRVSRLAGRGDGVNTRPPETNALRRNARARFAPRAADD